MTKLTGGVSGYYNAIDRVYAEKKGDILPSQPTLQYNAKVGFTISSALLPLPLDTVRLGQVCYYNGKASHPRTTSAYNDIRSAVMLCVGF